MIELARRMQLDANTEPLEEVIDAQLGVSLGIDFDELKRKGHVSPPLSYEKYRAIGGFLTPTRKIELYSTRLEQLGYDPLPHYVEPPESPLSNPELTREYPLVLTTGGRIPLLQLRVPTAPDTPQGPARPARGDSPRHRSESRHRQRRLGVDPHPAWSDPTAGSAH